ncbi:MAG: hypothetical protein EOP20_03850 [Hyphomicrobiales bacterium]|nr:MAG: hypothetical protein EOP20_03850 [Hyphomicrobiales bacterium]
MATQDQAFTLAQLAQISPWAFEQLAEVDSREVDSVIQAIAGNDDAAQPIFVWMRTVERCHSVLWRALDAQG